MRSFATSLLQGCRGGVIKKILNIRGQMVVRLKSFIKTFSMIAYAMPSLKCESEGGLKNRGYKHKSSNKKISERTLE